MKKIGLIILACIFLSSCSSNSVNVMNVNSANNVKNVIEKQIQESDKSNETNNKNNNSQNESSNNDTEDLTGADTMANDPSLFSEQPPAPKKVDWNNMYKDAKNTPDKSVDYDLTVMDSDMVYASVYQLMINPEAYVGKTFKMTGTFYAQYYEVTKKNYYYLIISDALACCAQGIEFVWGDGTHKYPDEYPPNETTATIKGRFETYKEPNDDRTYCRIANAEFTPVKEEK